MVSTARAEKAPKKFEGVSMRTEQALDDRLDRIAAEMSRRAAGVVVKRGSAAKAAMLRGLDAIERELGLVST